MKKSDLWLTILASVGVGAAAFYTMSKSDQPINKAMQTVAPMLSNTTNQTNSNNYSPEKDNSGQLGPYGMS